MINSLPGAMRAREILEALALADPAPITADHIRVSKALLTDPDYAGEFDPARVTAVRRDIAPKVTAEARELAFAKRLPFWRALTAVLYRAHASARRSRSRPAEAA